MSYTVEHAKQIPHDILKHTIKSKIDWNEDMKCWQMQLSVFFCHYYRNVLPEELSNTEKSIKDVFQGKWIDMISEYHDDLQKGYKVGIGEATWKLKEKDV